MQPREISGYRVVRPLGAGGMGEVFLVEHPRLPRQDALKLLGPQFGRDPESTGRFLREADILAGLRHPNIVTIYDRGEHEGRLWLSMEFVAGEDAARHLRASGPLPPETVAQVIEQVGSALDWAWSERRLTHRDVKPGNILLEPAGPGRPPRVKLVDFGIAKAGDGASLTATGVTVGTLAYMAPEVIEGKPLDSRADQYSLACTAFELLTGTPPFAAGAMSAVMMAHLHAPVPDPAARRAGLPARLAPVFARAMAKDPGARFADNAEFARAFRSAGLQGGAVPGGAVPGGAGSDAPGKVPAGNGRVMALAALVGGLVLLAAAVGYFAIRGTDSSAAGTTTTERTATDTAGAATDTARAGTPQVPGTDAYGFVGSPARCAGGETLELALLTTGEKSDSKIVVCSADGAFTYRGARAKGDNSGVTLAATRVAEGEYRAVNRSPSGKTDNDTVYTASSRGGLKITRGDGRSIGSEQVRSAWVR